MDSTPVIPEIYKSLRKKYLFVYLLATFADWLQGPYLYRLYSSYGYGRHEISLLYASGFASSTISGMLIGHFADTFGRKRLCIIYSLTTTISCLTTTLPQSNSYLLLIVARFFGGASTSILFSTFECWYVGQHLSRYKLDGSLISQVLTRATIYNSLLAIFAGIVSSLLADSFDWGPLSPFLLAVPISLLSGYSCAILWHENLSTNRDNTSFYSNLRQSLELLLFSKDRNCLLLLGTTQSLFETVMYIFVFLWTPVLEHVRISQGLIFGAFMLCVMIGSSLNSFLATKFRIRKEILLCLSIFLGGLSIVGATVGVYAQEINDIRGITVGSYTCLTSFLLFEISVGMYYPAIGYLRGIVLPESHRASIANWFRLPSNLLICLVLACISFQVPSNSLIFGACSCTLVIAEISVVKFARIFPRETKYRPIEKMSDSIEFMN